MAERKRTKQDKNDLQNSLTQQFTGKHVAPLGKNTLIPSQPVAGLTPSNCVLSEGATNTISDSLLFDPTCARTHDLSHSTRALYHLQHRRSSIIETFIDI